MVSREKRSMSEKGVGMWVLYIRFGARCCFAAVWGKRDFSVNCSLLPMLVCQVLSPLAAVYLDILHHSELAHNSQSRPLYINMLCYGHFLRYSLPSLSAPSSIHHWTRNTFLLSTWCWQMIRKVFIHQACHSQRVKDYIQFSSAYAYISGSQLPSWLWGRMSLANFTVT